MTNTSTKRKRGSGSRSALESQSNKKKKKKSAYRQNVRLDDLAWEQVAIPKGLDDYEGIYGLEEIDNVEVLRDPHTKLISYNGPTADEASIPTNGNDHNPGTDETDDIEWQGFSSHDELSSHEEDKPDSDADDASAVADSESDDTQSADFAEIPFGGLKDTNLDDEDGIDVSAWEGLKLSPETLSALSELKFSAPTPIQSSTIPEILAGHDVIGKASTGSGKTLAFGIPILEHCLASKIQRLKNGTGTQQTKTPTALILSPTRELAHQIGAHLKALCDAGSFDAPSIATVTGGLSALKQQRLLEHSDIIIGTPGRLWELMSDGKGLLERLKQIRFLVVDEADRLLSQGHFQELEDILSSLDKQETTQDGRLKSTSNPRRQTLVFSATFHKGLQQRLAGKGKPAGDLMSQTESMEYLLQKLNFRDEKPKFIDVNPVSQMASGLREGIMECGGMEKDLYLYFLLLLHSTKHILIFTNSISSVRRLTPLLTNLNLPALPLHSQMPQKARLRSVERFTASSSSILVATDVAARGLDIAKVELVVHYHVPRAADAYVHRSGRTARAGLEGSSVVLCSPEEIGGVRRLVVKVHAGSKGQGKRALKTLDVDRKAVTRLKPRLVLAKRIADVGLAKEKKAGGDALFKQAAEDLGVDYDSEEMDKAAKGKRSRGGGRKKKEREDRELSKDEVKAMRAELRALLAKRVNAGVSERYLTGGAVDIEALLKGEKGEFLGGVRELDFEI